MGTKLGTITTILFLVLASLTFIPEISNIQSSLGTSFGQYLGLFFLFGFFVVYGIINIVAVVFIIRGVDLVNQKICHKDLSIISLEDSKPFLGGVLFFEVKHSGVLNKGYFRIWIRSPFNDRDKFTQYYDETAKKGTLNDKFKNHKFRCKWNIPVNFTSGEFKITIEMRDVITVFGLKKHYLVKKYDLLIPIKENLQKQTISVHSVTHPNLKELANINPNSKPIIGWICLKIQNQNDYDVIDCFGNVMTDCGDFPLYDYELFVKNQNKPNLEDYRIFPIRHNSTKRLYANIKSNKPKVTAYVDFDNEEIKEELSLFNSSLDTH